MSQTVADVLVGVLQEVGVKQVFGLIGDSLNPLADAIRRSNIEWIGVRHEEGAALAASGQAKLTGHLAVCAVRPVRAAPILYRANGIQALDRSRQVIALCGDGGFNMLMCEFLTPYTTSCR